MRLDLTRFPDWMGLIVVWAAGRESNPTKIYWLALTGGLLTDLLIGNRLGVSAAVYLLAALLIFLFKQRFRFGWFTLIIFSLLTQAAWFFLVWQL